MQNRNSPLAGILPYDNKTVGGLISKQTLPADRMDTFLVVDYDRLQILSFEPICTEEPQLLRLACPNL